MSKRTLFLIFALFVITFALIIIALYSPSVPKPLVTIPPIIRKEPAAQTQLLFGSLSMTNASPSSKTTYSLPITISTGNNKVTAVQLELQYDPEILAQVAVVPSAFFPNPVTLLNQIDTKTGRISYAFGVGPTATGITGNGMLAKLTFQAKALSDVAKQTSITFLPKTLVTAEGSLQSVLKQTSSSQFTVGK